MHGIAAALTTFLAEDPTNSTGGAVNTAFGGISDQMWLVIPGGLALFAIIFGLAKVKKAGKTAAA